MEKLRIEPNIVRASIELNRKMLCLLSATKLNLAYVTCRICPQQCNTFLHQHVSFSCKLWLLCLHIVLQSSCICSSSYLGLPAREASCSLLFTGTTRSGKTCILAGDTHRQEGAKIAEEDLMWLSTKMLPSA